MDPHKRQSLLVTNIRIFKRDTFYTEVEKMAGKDFNHKNKYENDKDFREMLTEMSNVMSAVELSTKTRKFFEDNLKNMIDGADRVLMNKCTEIWAVFDEMPIELQQVTRTSGQ